MLTPTCHTLGIFTLSLSIPAWRVLTEVLNSSKKCKKIQNLREVLLWIGSLCNQANQSPKCNLDVAQRPYDTWSPNGHSLREVLLVCSVKSPHSDLGRKSHLSSPFFRPLNNQRQFCLPQEFHK